MTPESAPHQAAQERLDADFGSARADAVLSSLEPAQLTSINPQECVAEASARVVKIMKFRRGFERRNLVV
ncbi:hypothetical protein [Novosphingobium sp. PhB165]|uniref:hypothetical protein n=1 Tax=Novosphingobium sp. PhB165 TaxID=2485105 RepID=UPI0014048864|nr:hypothetical protein [Novosphingobium sp. PhB165]